MAVMAFVFVEAFVAVVATARPPRPSWPSWPLSWLPSRSSLRSWPSWRSWPLRSSWPLWRRRVLAIGPRRAGDAPRAPRG